jgi:hypothetical protein
MCKRNDKLVLVLVVMRSGFLFRFVTQILCILENKYFNVTYRVVYIRHLDVLCRCMFKTSDRNNENLVKTFGLEWYITKT